MLNALPFSIFRNQFDLKNSHIFESMSSLYKELIQNIDDESFCVFKKMLIPTLSIRAK